MLFGRISEIPLFCPFCLRAAVGVRLLATILQRKFNSIGKFVQLKGNLSRPDLPDGDAELPRHLLPPIARVGDDPRSPAFGKGSELALDPVKGIAVLA